MEIKMETASLHNGEMEYARFGVGKKFFIIIPGLSIKNILKSAAIVAESSKIFAEEYTVYLFDRRKMISPGYSLKEMADDIAEAMKNLGISNADIFGFSQGGMIAQDLAIRYPNLVHKMILGSTSSRPEPLQLKVIGEWMRLAKAGDSSGLVNRFIDDAFSKKFVERYRRALLALYRKISTEELARFFICAKACNEVNTYDELEKIQCPVLVIRAGQDGVLSLEASLKIANKLKSLKKSCEFYVYEDGGHAAPDEIPDYKERMLRFFQQESI